MYIKTSRNKSDNYLRLINYFNGGSFFESVTEPIGGSFTIYTEDDNDPDPDVSSSDDDNPEVSTDNDAEDPEVSTDDDSSSNDDSSSDDSDNDDSSDDSNDDSGDDNNGSDDSDSGNDSGDDDGSDDMDSDPHDMGDDDEDPDAGSDDESSSDDSSNRSDDEKGKPGTDFENMRRYNLYKKFMSLADSINGYTDTLDALVYDDNDLNTITKTVSSKLKQLSEIMYDYMTMKFENDSYTQALLFYHEVNAGVRMCFDLLESKNTINPKRH